MTKKSLLTSLSAAALVLGIAAANPVFATEVGTTSRPEEVLEKIPTVEKSAQPDKLAGTIEEVTPTPHSQPKSETPTTPPTAQAETQPFTVTLTTVQDDTGLVADFSGILNKATRDIGMMYYIKDKAKNSYVKTSVHFAEYPKDASSYRFTTKIIDTSALTDGGYTLEFWGASGSVLLDGQEYAGQLLTTADFEVKAGRASVGTPTIEQPKTPDPKTETPTEEPKTGETAWSVGEGVTVDKPDLTWSVGEGVTVDKPDLSLPVGQVKTSGQETGFTTSSKTTRPGDKTTADKPASKTVSPAKTGKSDEKELPKTGDATSLLSVIGISVLGLAGLVRKKHQ